MMRRLPRLARAGVVLGALGAALAGCAGEPDEQTESAAESAPVSESVSHTSESGPVRATVSLSPKQPVLGDPLTLSLEVQAEAGVEVEMPAFGEALGRFEIVQFVPREQRGADGKLVASQTYTLQAPMSGRQRIPPLQVEFVDRRNAGAAGAAGTAGAAGAAGTAAGEEVQELLTEEIPIQIGSVLPDGAVTAELRPERAVLPLRSRVQLYAWLGVGALVLLGAGGFLGVRAWRRAARRQVRISAYDRAMGRLRELEQRGLPRPGQEQDAPAVDLWYVELSAIVRRYLEDRYGLRAPELTTEEFLREAQRSGQLSSTHRNLLSDFLVRCDRVKFARYEPDEEESRQALASARSFLEETRLVVSPADRAGNGRAGGGQAASQAGQTADQKADQTAGQTADQPADQPGQPGQSQASESGPASGAGQAG